MEAILGLLMAGFGVLTGLVWRFGWMQDLELKCFLAINKPHLWDWVDQLINRCRRLGSNWALLMVLIVVLLWQTQIGISLSAAALITAILERGIKLLLKRPRPFESDSEVILRQDPAPRDPSFPSGDAMRLWFLFAALAFGIIPPFFVILFIGVCALFLSIGRIRLGVHYPLDVWAGSGLGFGIGLAWAGFFCQ
jgi:membrane-associated phospholipid phosphatase